MGGCLEERGQEEECLRGVRHYQRKVGLGTKGLIGNSKVRLKRLD